MWKVAELGVPWLTVVLLYSSTVPYSLSFILYVHVVRGKLRDFWSWHGDVGVGLSGPPMFGNSRR